MFSPDGVGLWLIFQENKNSIIKDVGEARVLKPLMGPQGLVGGFFLSLEIRSGIKKPSAPRGVIDAEGENREVFFCMQECLSCNRCRCGRDVQHDCRCSADASANCQNFAGS